MFRELLAAQTDIPPVGEFAVPDMLEPQRHGFDYVPASASGNRTWNRVSPGFEST